MPHISTNGRSLKTYSSPREHQQSPFCESLCNSAPMTSVDDSIFHDINNLLLIIKFSSEELLRGLSHDDRYLAAILAINDATIRATHLTRQLQTADQKTLPHFQSVDLNDAIVQRQPTIEQVMKDNVVFAIDLMPRPAMIQADPEKLDQILMNLVLNALVSVSDGGWIKIETRLVKIARKERERSNLTVGSYVQLNVSDTGYEAERPADFEEDFAGDPAARALNHAATRLSVVERIVKECGGQIFVKGSLERGTRVEIYFPAVHANIAPQGLVNEPLRVVSGEKTILLVDDEALVRRCIKRILESEGYKVLEAGDRNSAIATSCDQSTPFHLLLTDLMLQGESGHDIAADLRVNDPGLPVIFMSGEANDLASSEEDDGISFLQKPFRPTDLLALVRDALDCQPKSSDAFHSNACRDNG